MVVYTYCVDTGRSGLVDLRRPYAFGPDAFDSRHRIGRRSDGKTFACTLVRRSRDKASFMIFFSRFTTTKDVNYVFVIYLYIRFTSCFQTVTILQIPITHYKLRMLIDFIEMRIEFLGYNQTFMKSGFQTNILISLLLRISSKCSTSTLTFISEM